MTSAPSEALAALAEEYWQQTLRRNPIVATFYGDYRYNAELPQIDAQSRAAEERDLRSLLSRLDALESAGGLTSSERGPEGGERAAAAKPAGFQGAEPLVAEGEISTRGLHAAPAPGFLGAEPLVDEVETKTPSLHPSAEPQRWRDRQDAITAQMLRLALEAQLSALRLRLDEMSVDQMDGPQVWLLELINWHPTDTVEHAEQLIQRYKAFDTFMDQYLEVLDEGVRDHRTAPRIAVDRVQAQLEALLQKPLDAWPMAQLATAQPELKSALDDVLDGTVAPAFRRMATYLQSYAARPEPGVWSVTNGDEIYALLARQHTTTDLTPDELHQIGLDDLHHIHAEMQAIMARRGANGASIREFTERLTRDPANLPNSREELIAISERLLAQAQAALPKAFGRLPRSPIVVKPVEEYRERDAPAAYYFQPSPDGSRPGVFYVNTFEPEARPRHTLPALAFHEGVPGHHLQIAIAQEAEGLPAFRRFSAGWLSTAFVEGWALYTERLADELGLYPDDLARFGMLGYQAWRACRLVVDTGLHHKRWTRQQALDFFYDNVGLTERETTNEVDRYIVWPGQALAYKIGQRQIEALRRAEASRLGPRFHLPSFHDALLAQAAVPLSALPLLLSDAD